MSDDAKSLTVTFATSGQTFAWTGEHRTILDLAIAEDVPINYGCTYGDCGTCQAAVLEGEVEYLHETGAEPDPGTCLPCSCRPKSSVVLRA